MSTLAEIKTAVKNFVYNNSVSNDAFQGVTAAATLEARIDAAILVALNNARSFAEKNHDFAMAQVSVPVTLTNAGLNIINLGGGAPKMKKIIGVDLDTGNGTFKPLLFTTMQDLRSRMRLDDKTRPAEVYHEGSASDCHEAQIVLDGLSLNSYPLLTSGQSMDLILRGYKWLNRYTALDTTTDWLIENGFDFFMWSAVVELNHIVQIYLPRQEGSLPPPERLKQDAWEALVIVDADLTNFYNE